MAINNFHELVENGIIKLTDTSGVANENGSKTISGGKMLRGKYADICKYLELISTNIDSSYVIQATDTCELFNIKGKKLVPINMGGAMG